VRPADGADDASGRKALRSPEVVIARIPRSARLKAVRRPAALLAMLLLTGFALGGCGGSKVSDPLPKSTPDITPPNDTSIEKAAGQTTSTSTSTSATKSTSTTGEGSSESGSEGSKEGGEESSSGGSAGAGGGTAGEKEKTEGTTKGGSEAGGGSSPTGGASAP
jgi:hypothetical protein